jgi:hypothetical protein
MGSGNLTWFEARDYMFDCVGIGFVMVFIVYGSWILLYLLGLLVYTECGRYIDRAKEEERAIDEWRKMKHAREIEERKIAEEREEEVKRKGIDEVDPPSPRKVKMCMYKTRSWKETSG